jgi:hypothetical protein
VALQLTNLVEGIYTFHLRVTDSQGASDTDIATVEVQAGMFIGYAAGLFGLLIGVTQCGRLPVAGVSSSDCSWQPL